MFAPKEKKSDFDIFVIYDSKVQAYDMPVFAINEHDLTRQIVNMFKDPDQKNNKHLVNAEDYSVFKVGGYTKKDGKFQSHNPEHIANMHDLRAVAFATRSVRPEGGQDLGIHST